MKSNTCFSLSGPIVKENMRRFWPVPAVTFIVYLLTGILPMLTGSSVNNVYDPYAVNSFLMNQHPAVALTLIMPTIAAMVVFRYLHQSAGTTYMNSLPFSRTRLFNSNYVSGLLMVLVPMLLMGVILLAISMPTYYEYTYEAYGAVKKEAVNLFAPARVLEWMLVNAVIIFVDYSIAVFAGVITGSVVLHLCYSAFFTVTPMAVYLGISYLMNRYLFGYSDGNIMTVVYKLFPWVHSIVGFDGAKGWTMLAVYFVVALVITALTYFLYMRRKMETAGDGTSFGFVAPLVTYLGTFFGTLLMGIYFEAVDRPIVVGFVLGALITFIAARMIVLKTVKVFDLKFLKNFAIYAVIAAALIACIAVDIFSYEDRTGEKSGSVTMDYFSRNDYYYSSTADSTFESPENVAKVAELHRAIVADKAKIKGSDVWSSSKTIDIEYANGVSRRYAVPGDWVEEHSDIFKALYESEEFKQKNSLTTRVDGWALESVRVSDESGYTDVTLNYSEVKSFLEACDADFRESKYEDFAKKPRIYCMYTISLKKWDENNDVLYNNITGAVTIRGKHAMAWLKEHGYDYLALEPEDVSRITVSLDGVYSWGMVEDDYMAAQRERQGYYIPVDLSKRDGIPEYTTDDPKEIREIMDLMYRDNENHYQYMDVSIYFNSRGYADGLYGYSIDLDDAPAWLLDKFK